MRCTATMRGFEFDYSDGACKEGKQVIEGRLDVNKGDNNEREG